MVVLNGLLICSISLAITYAFIFRKKMTMPQWKLSAIPIGIIITIGVVWFYLHNFQDGLFYHHLGPDMISFTSSADWIGTHGNMLATAPETRELLVVALRWGLPACLAVIKLALHTSVYQIIFPVILIIFSHCIVLTTLLITDKYQQDWQKTGQIIAIAILLQGSLLNFMNEGFYPYIIGVGYFSVISAFSQLHSRALKLPYQSLIIVALCIGTLIVTCSELFSLTAMFLIGVTVIRQIKTVKALRYIDLIDDILVNSFLDGRLLNTWTLTTMWGAPLPKMDVRNKAVVELLSKKIMLIGNKTHFPKALLQDHQPILKTRSYYVFDTGSNLAELVQGEDEDANMQRIYAKLHETYR